jgi:RNA polymerase sigma-70 factor (ECF subfamily)
MQTDNKSPNMDSELVKRLQAGELKAFDELFEQYRSGILAYVIGITHDRGIAEEITQDCFLALVKHRDRLNPRRSVSGWLYRVARNRAIDVMRHRKFEVLPGDEYLDVQNEEGGDVPMPESALVQKEERQALLDAMHILSDREKELLMLRFRGDLTFKEISEVVKRPLGTVLWSTRRALAKLREKLEGGHDYDM